MYYESDTAMSQNNLLKKVSATRVANLVKKSGVYRIDTDSIFDTQAGRLSVKDTQNIRFKRKLQSIRIMDSST
jgi:hypothetical protein